VLAKINIDLGAGPGSAFLLAPELDLTRRDGIPVPADGPVDWARLKDLPYLRALHWQGPERGVIEAVRTHFLTYLKWFNAEGDLDLTPTGVVGAEFGGAGLRRVALPPTAEMVALHEPPPDLRVEAPSVTELRMFCEHSEKIKIPQGLHGVRKLWLRASASFSFAVLDGLTGLEELRVDLRRPPGTLTEWEKLLRHKRLRSLDLVDAYDWDPHSLPDLPSLRELTLDGTRRTTASVVKARFKGTGVEVGVEGAKSDRWLAEAIDNPFRDWIEESKPFGKAACKAYVRAAEAVRAGEVEGGLRGLGTDLWALHDKYGLIDTLLREQAWDIFLELAEGTGVSEERLESWFDGRA
jgi:hypothetical protein